MRKFFLTGTVLMIASLNSAVASEMTCEVIADFSSAEEASRWGVQNDNVMGGRSTGGPSFEKGHLTFSGYTNMEGGGFSSIRARHATDAFSKADAVRLMLKSDAREYQLAFRTTARDMLRRAYAFRIPIPQTPVGEWTSVTVPLKDFSVSIWGQAKKKAFDRTQVTEYGLFIYDGVTGPFSLDVKTMEVCMESAITG